MNPSQNRRPERFDEQRSNESNTYENNRTVASWSRTEHSVNGANDGSEWAASRATLCTNGRDTLRNVRLKSLRTCLLFFVARSQKVLITIFQ